jgi:DNA modification methylase
MDGEENNRTSYPNDLFRELAMVWIKLNLIVAAPRRVRRAPEKQIEAVMEAVKAFGFRVPILVRYKPDGERYEVVDGHVRLEAARRLGAEQLPCIIVDDLSDVHIRRLRLSLNKLQETGEWDIDVLRIEFTELLEIGVDLQVTGFEVPEIDLVLQDHTGDPSDQDPLDDLDDLSARQSRPVTCSGDIWIVGSHRILCGRAQDMEGFAARAFSGNAAMVIQDPPFNLKISGHVSTVKGRHGEFAEASGEMQPAEFVRFLTDSHEPALNRLRPGGLAYVFMDWRHMSELQAAFRNLGVELINVAVWVKHAPGMGALYRSQHEFVFVVRKPGAQHRNNVQLGRFGRNRSNVWTYGGATSGNTEEDDFSVHPTVKPVAMIRDAILDVTAPGEIVIDCFLGSGSTLIAAETAHRRCIGVEIEPVYVDLAVRRWMNLTGREVFHAATGEPFETVAERRATKLLPAPDREGADD